MAKSQLYALHLLVGFAVLWLVCSHAPLAQQAMQDDPVDSCVVSGRTQPKRECGQVRE